MNQVHRQPLPAATFHILVALADQDRHGYAILRDIRERTDGEFHIGPATLYTTIKRLLAAGLIKEIDPPGHGASDPRRRSYALTAAGRDAALAEAERLESLVRQARTRFAVSRRRTRSWA